MDRKINLSSVESVVFGPQTFTFKSYKLQHLIDKLERAITKNENGQDKLGSTFRHEHHPPRFYAWECVSLKTAERTLDFVILDESLIIKFIQGVHLLV